MIEVAQSLLPYPDPDDRFISLIVLSWLFPFYHAKPLSLFLIRLVSMESEKVRVVSLWITKITEILWLKPRSLGPEYLNSIPLLLSLYSNLFQFKSCTYIILNSDDMRAKQPKLSMRHKTTVIYSLIDSFICWFIHSFIHCYLINPFPNDKFYTLLHRKSLQTIILYFMKTTEVLQMGRKHCGKRKNCSLRAIYPFPVVFSKEL